MTIELWPLPYAVTFNAWAFLLLVPYLLPSLVAGVLMRRNLPAILALNILAGWTFFGWVGALVWALKREPVYFERNYSGHPFPVSKSSGY